MEIKTFHSFRSGDKTCCLNGDDLTVRTIDAATARLLADVEANPGLAETPDVRSALERLGLAPAEPVTSVPPPAPGPVSALTLCLTDRCNLRCVYCYGEDGGPRTVGDMREETAKAAVDWLLERSGGASRLTVAFFGGEPLLNFPVMRSAAAYAKERCAKAGKTVSFSLTTNATLIDRNKADWIIREITNLAISCDGPKELHDARRPRRDGSGSFNAMRQGLERLLRRFPRENRLLGRAVWTGRDDPGLVRDALAALGFPRISLGQATPPGRPGTDAQRPPLRDLAPLAALAEQEAAALLACVKARNADLAKRQPRATPIALILRHMLHAEKKRFFCGGGRASLAVSPHGDIYPCHRFVRDPSSQLGDLTNGAAGRERYGAGPVAARQSCRRCFARYLCGGGCPHDHRGMTGDADAPAPDFCALMRRQAEIAAALSLELDLEDRRWLVAHKIVSPKYCPLDF